MNLSSSGKKSIAFNLRSLLLDSHKMGSSTLFASFRLPFKHNHEFSPSSSHFAKYKGINNNKSHNIQMGLQSSLERVEKECSLVDEEFSDEKFLKRRSVVSGLSLATAAVLGLGLPRDGLAVKQGLLAGRVPGLSDPDEQGWRTYRRPDEKSGGHGVGWSPIIPYTFSVPQEWEEVPVSIADLGGTEIDLRFASSKQGRLFVIVAPVLRFADNLGDDVKIENIGPPDKVINAFGPEAIGDNVEGKVLNMEVTEYSGRKYYQYELEPPHALITATAAGNRLYLFTVTANGLQWKRNYGNLKRIAASFRVV